MTVNINAGDVFVEVIGSPKLSMIENLPGVCAARVWPYARLGDATLQLRTQPGAPLRAVLEHLQALGLTVLAGRRADPPPPPVTPRASTRNATLEQQALTPRLR